MKKLLFLLIPSLLLSSCGKSVVTYDEYHASALEAHDKLVEVFLDDLVVEGKGSTFRNGISHRFTLHELYLYKDGRYQRDNSVSRCETDDVFASTTLMYISSSLVNKQARDVEGNESFTYSVSPLQVSIDGATLRFDEYGMAIKYMVNDTNFGNITMNVNRKYEQVKRN